MRVIINGKPEEVAMGVTLLELIETRQLHPSRVVAELNREIVPGDRFANTILSEGDRLELLQFVGGG
ncbi:sulfur carrier protein ThiS [Desulfonatronum thioautotrophicum]|uniref:sulfur carrier protein ThiS n=1 Tax=Desulfonatronum thioautotrophicum TaxID=617001 RepID=UPI0005EB49F9|nr:sulfur carrier protein ThiS [Desulfonatronum thioautotrophicum]